MVGEDYSPGWDPFWQWNLADPADLPLLFPEKITRLDGIHSGSGTWQILQTCPYFFQRRLLARMGSLLAVEPGRSCRPAPTLRLDDAFADGVLDQLRAGMQVEFSHDI